MRTVFDELEVWSSKKQVSLQTENKNIIIRLVKDRIVINPECFIGAIINSFDPSDDINETDKKVLSYLNDNDLEMFQIICENATFKGLVKPKNILLKDFLEL